VNIIDPLLSQATSGVKEKGKNQPRNTRVRRARMVKGRQGRGVLGCDSFFLAGLPQTIAVPNFT
jgi:hypothetical protein